MSERQSNTAKSPEERLRKLAEEHLTENKSPVEMLGIVASQAVVGWRSSYSPGEMYDDLLGLRHVPQDSPLRRQGMSRFDIAGSSRTPDGYQTISIHTYRPNVPRWDVSRTGEVIDHEEAPAAIYWQANNGSEAGPVHQYGSQEPVSPKEVGELAGWMVGAEPIHETKHTRHSL